MCATRIDYILRQYPGSATFGFVSGLTDSGRSPVPFFVAVWGWSAETQAGPMFLSLRG